MPGDLSESIRMALDNKPFQRFFWIIHWIIIKVLLWYALLQKGFQAKLVFKE